MRTGIGERAAERQSLRRCAQLLQFCVFRLSLFQDGDVRVGVFPEGKEVFVRGKGANAGGVAIRWRALFALDGRGDRPHTSLQRIRTRHAEERQRARPTVPHYAAMVENLLELGGGLRALSSS